MGQGRRDHGLQAGTEKYANQSSAHLCGTLRAKARREDGTGGPEAGAGVGGSAAKSGITPEGLTDSTSGLLSPRSASPHRQVTRCPPPWGAATPDHHGSPPLSQSSSLPPLCFRVSTHCPDPSVHQAAQPAPVWAREEGASHTRVTH